MDLNVMLPSANDKSAYRCSDCGRGYHTVRDLVSHQGVHTGEYPYVCEYCHKGYKCKMNLVNHINLHTGEGYQCDKCKKVCGSAFLLKQHVRWHVKEKPFVCKVCGKAFKVVEILRAHEKQAHSTKLYSCAQCKKKMTSEKTLQAHMKNHGLRNVACPYCSRVYKNCHNLQQHLLVHESTMEELLTCPDCGARFLHARRLRSHVERCHSQPKKNNCIYCGICVDSEEALNNHIVEHRKTTPAPCHVCGGPLLRRHVHKNWTVGVTPEICCPRCTAQFYYPAELLEHARIHGDDPAKLKWECYTCGRYFLCRNQYEKHLTRPHPRATGAVDSGFICNSCCKSFKNVSDLKEHVKIHFDDLKKERAYLCLECGKACSTLAALNYHRRQHLNANLFPCLYCPEAFKALAQMRLHMKLHLGCTGAVRCHPCDMQFMRKESYSLHLKLHCDNGDGVCMKCLVAFSTEEHFAAHNRIHSLPYKCSKCGEQFDNMELFKRHVAKGHCCTKLFLCGRCNLGLLSAEDLQQHEDNHVKEDATNAKKVKCKLLKNQEISVNSNIQNVSIPILKTYCTCLFCNPSPSSSIDMKFVGVSARPDKNCKIIMASASSVPVTNHACTSFFQSATIYKINEALVTLEAQKIPYTPDMTTTLSSPHVPEMPALSKTQEVQTLLQSATVKKVVLTLPVQQTSAAAPVRSEAVITSFAKTEFTPMLIPYQNCEGIVCVAVPHQVAVALPDNISELEVDPCKTVASYLEIDNSIIIPDVTEGPNVLHIKNELQLTHPHDDPLFTLFCELLVRVLGQETVQRLSYTIMADVRVFLLSFLPSVEVNAMEITTENTIWLFIQSMARLFGEDNDELVIDHALNDLDSKSLVQEMLRCIDSDNFSS